MEMDFEDFVEEVKFQMTNYDVLEESIILEWEVKARKWIEINKRKPYLTYKASDDIYVAVKSEEVMEKIALDYYRAVKNGKKDIYWNKFRLL